MTYNKKSLPKMVDMYVAMVDRKLKNIEEVPSVFRKQVREKLGL